MTIGLKKNCTCSVSEKGLCLPANGVSGEEGLHCGDAYLQLQGPPGYFGRLQVKPSECCRECGEHSQQRVGTVS